MQNTREQKTWINKEGNDKLENSVLVNERTGENCKPLRPKHPACRKPSKTSCQCRLF